MTPDAPTRPNAYEIPSYAIALHFARLATPSPAGRRCSQGDISPRATMERTAGEPHERSDD